MAIFRSDQIVLGELEMSVCNDLWDHGEADVRTVYERVGAARMISSNTIQSTLDRLFRKRVLVRRKVGNAYVYGPGLSREQLAGKMLDSVAAMMGTAGRRPLLTAFLDMAGRSQPELLTRLEKLIAKARARDRR